MFAVPWWIKPRNMKKLLVFLAITPVALFAQTTWEVEAGGSMLPGNPAPYYSPADITINVGDAVHWTAVSGTHNVYGMPDAFPANPEGFTSGDPSSNLNYTHVFTIAGTYGYHCTQNGHAATQHGTITVVGTEQIDGPSQTSFGLYPLPAHDELNVVRGTPAMDQVEITDAAGRVVARMTLGSTLLAVIPVRNLLPGTYFLRLAAADGTAMVRAFVKE